MSEGVTCESERLPVLNPLRALLGLETQPYYKAPGDHGVEIRLTLREWGCPFDSGPKLAMASQAVDRKMYYANTTSHFPLPC